MSVYAQLGLEPIINAAGTSTRVGGPLMHPAAAQAMAEAAGACIALDHLEGAASRIIADVTGAEAGYVTAGAAAGLTLSAAACLAGLDIAIMDRLPDTSGLPNEIIVCREQRNGYDHALRAAGARLVEVGMNERVAGAGVRRTETWEIEAALSDRTVAVAYFATPDSAPPLEEVGALCRRRGVPLIVDAAGQLPPAANLRRFTAAGADLVTFSGGKALRGPQSTGIVAGRRDLIMSIALQHLDLDEHWSTWTPPENLIDKARLRGFPRHGLGRGFKVAREEIVAILVALRCFVDGDYRADIARFHDYLRTVADGLANTRGLCSTIHGGADDDHFPVLELAIDEAQLGVSAFEVTRRLKCGTPSVYVNESRLHEGVLVLHAIGLEERLLGPLTERLRAVVVATDAVEARLGIDIGGTFTDLVLVEADGRVLTYKVLSTPHDFGAAIVAGVRELLDQREVRISDVVHGTTICSNAILEGKGARTGLITTRGFRDALEIGRMRYPRLYDLTWSKPPPLVPRRRRLEVSERLDRDGGVVEVLDESSVVDAVRALLAEGIESLAVCLLHSYIDGCHEVRVRDIAERLAPELPISLSSEVLPEIGEYERTSTTVINAYLQPVVGGYLTSLARSLDAVGVHAPVYVMQSNGGIMAASTASQRPIHIVESGPAAGVIAAQHLARECGLSDVIALDMGGTTAKASIIESGNLQRAAEFEVAGGLNVGNRLNTGAGYKLRVPAIDVAEVGAGGGSLVSVDAGGALHVGPESAGAVPGPVCYALGGTQPTLTDANLALGYLNPTALLGGTLSIDFARAESAFRQLIAEPLGLDVLRAAHGVHQIAVANMVRAVKAISSERGRDPRRFACVAYGGNGPLHAISAAVELGISLVVVPPSPGVFSAFGLLTAEPSVHAARSLLCATSVLTPATLEHAYRALEQEVTQTLLAQGHVRAQVELDRTIEVHYAGQSFELSLTMPSSVDGTAIAAIDERFAAEHERTYGHRAEDDPVEVVHIRVQGRVPGRPVSRRAVAATAPESVRRAYFGGQHGVLETPVVQRGNVDGAARSGPLIVEEYDATTLVPPGWHIRRDERDNLLIERA